LKISHKFESRIRGVIHKSRSLSERKKGRQPRGAKLRDRGGGVPDGGKPSDRGGPEPHKRNSATNEEIRNCSTSGAQRKVANLVTLSAGCSQSETVGHVIQLAELPLLTHSTPHKLGGGRTKGDMSACPGSWCNLKATNWPSVPSVTRVGATFIQLPFQSEFLSRKRMTTSFTYHLTSTIN